MPDRIERAAGQVQSAAHDLVNEVKKERKSRRLGFALIAVALIAIVCLVVSNHRSTERRQKRDQVELTQRLCAAWDNRVEDHATLTDYLDEFVGASSRGQQFVSGLRVAYAKSDARYAKERGLTRSRCS